MSPVLSVISNVIISKVIKSKVILSILEVWKLSKMLVIFEVFLACIEYLCINKHINRLENPLGAVADKLLRCNHFSNVS
jgi:hypothetical protein